MYLLLAELERLLHGRDLILGRIAQRNPKQRLLPKLVERRTHLLRLPDSRSSNTKTVSIPAYMSYRDEIYTERSP